MYTRPTVWMNETHQKTHCGFAALERGWQRCCRLGLTQLPTTWWEPEFCCHLCHLSIETQDVYVWMSCVAEKLFSGCHKASYVLPAPCSHIPGGDLTGTGQASSCQAIVRYKRLRPVYTENDFVVPVSTFWQCRRISELFFIWRRLSKDNFWPSRIFARVNRPLGYTQSIYRKVEPWVMSLSNFQKVGKNELKNAMTSSGWTDKWQHQVNHTI
jgi:hypothetical protein